RNIGGWSPGVNKPTLKDQGKCVVVAQHAALGSYTIQFDAPDRLLFCENETNFVRLFGATSGERYPKDAFHEYIVEHRAHAVNPAGEGTKTAGLYRRTIPAGGNVVVRVRLCAGPPATDGLAALDDPFKDRLAE